MKLLYFLTQIILFTTLFLMVGCSYKYLRTKPTTFIDLDRDSSKYQCIDANEYYTSTETANCDGYISVNKK